MTAGLSKSHHANEAMKCAADGEVWPCLAFKRALKHATRREADRPLVVRVDPAAKVAR